MSIHLFTLAFVILKLTGYINWAWVWVLAPSWVTLASVLTAALFMAAINVFNR